MKGYVESIIYKNNANFMICRISSKDIPVEYRDEYEPTECIVLGTMSLYENLRYEFSGQWTKNEQYGWQLKVKEYKELPPDGKNKKALIAYLSSGLFNGIGPTLGERIVDTFKDDTLNIIATKPEELAKVKGITKKKALSIFNDYIRNKEYQEVMLMLRPFDISTNKILKLIETYKDKTIEMLKTNPYDVCRQISGFGFLTADSLALASGISRKNHFRVKEGIKYCLENSAQQKGNLYLTKQMLGINLSKLLNNDLSDYIFNQYKMENGKNPTREEFDAILADNFVDEHDVLTALEELRREKEVILEYEDNVTTKKTPLYDKDKNIIGEMPKNEVFSIVNYVDKNFICISHNNQNCFIDTSCCNAIQFDCYSSLYYNCEQLAAKHINRLLYSTQIKTITGSLPDAIAKLEKKYDIEYAKQQKDAIMTMIKKNLLIVTGGPGTGKTTLIKGIIGTYQHFFPHDTIVMAAPTGRAAKRMTETTGMQAVTVHRLLEYGFDGFARNEENPVDADVILIDESSMIDILLFVALIKAVPTSCKFILVGDVDQLPAVGPGNVLKSLIESKKVPVVYLNEIFRQANTSKIVINAYKINHNETKLDYGTDFNYTRMEDFDYPNLQDAVIKEMVTQYRHEIDKYKNVNDVQILVPFRVKRKISVNELNKILAPIANPRPKDEICINYGINTFHINDKVMQMKNNYEKNVFNGDIGYVKFIEKSPVGGYLMYVDFGLAELVEYNDFDELELAYASTIHKSQGSEYKSVIIPILKEQDFFLQKCVLYTAITRAKEKCSLIGQYQALMTAIGRNNVSERKTKLAQRVFDF